MRGIVAGEAVTVVQTDWFGGDALTLTYRRSSGAVADELLYRSHEARLEIDGSARGWTFDADGGEFRLAAEARRIQLAYLFDPRLAVHLSVLEPLPHQIQAVYGVMLPRHPLRFALCDDPGAGKTSRRRPSRHGQQRLVPPPRVETSPGSWVLPGVAQPRVHEGLLSSLPYRAGRPTRQSCPAGRPGRGRESGPTPRTSR